MERSVLVTGGVGGLGEAVVEILRDQNWRVVAPVRAGAVGRLAKGAVGIEADLSVPADVRAAVALAAGEPDAPLRAVVNLVGGYAGGGLVHETAIEDFEAVIRANLRPTYLVTAAALPHLVDAAAAARWCASRPARPWPRSPARPVTRPPRPRCWPSPTPSRSSTERAVCVATQCCRA
nr:hypothetical protein GCM10020092_093570 [Actinoplanes digitatis]